MFAAVPYELEEPLLQQKKAKSLDESLFRSFKMSSLCLGVIVGFFIQASTLGANYLVITVWGEDVMHTSKRDIVYFSLIWSLFTSSLAIVILSFLRSLVRSTYETDNEQVNEKLDDMILHMECRFFADAFAGDCSAWALTDVILGMSVQIVYSLATLGVALAYLQYKSRKEKARIFNLEKKISLRLEEIHA